MKRVRNLVLAIAFAGFAPNASAIVLGGIEFNGGAMQAQTSVFETAVTLVGDVLSGVGEIGLIDGQSAAQFCVGGPCEVTFRFNGYVVTSITATTVTFTGGTIDIYADFGGGTLDFNPIASGGVMATDIAAATDGTLLLTLEGHTILTTITGAPVPATLAGAGAILGGVIAGFGEGGLDVDLAGAGIANANFDTDTFADGLGGTFDLTLDSSFTTAGGIGQWPVGGSNTLNGFVIPEPGVLALLGVGLLLAGMTRRRT